MGPIDPPREQAIAALAECQHAGIRTKMITDNVATIAQAVREGRVA